MAETEVYNSYSKALLNKYGYRIFRVGVDAGFSCPNRCNGKNGCAYCDSQGATAAYLRKNESSYSGKSGFEREIDQKASKTIYNDISEQIKRSREFLIRRYKAEHFALYFQSFSNTFAPVAKLKEVYDKALEGYEWDGLIISTRPDCIDEEKIKLIASYKEKCKNVCIELGLESGDDRILNLMERGHNVETLIKACELVKKYNIELGLHIMMGYPTETQKELDSTISVINRVHPYAVKIHNLNICSGTALFSDYLKGEVTSPCATRCIFLTEYILRRIKRDIIIERLLCETPSHRLASPRRFPDKNNYIEMLRSTMQGHNARQGDLYKEEKI